MNHKGLHRSGHSVSGMFVFLLIGAFAIASITLVLSGISVYRHVTDEAASNAERQLSLSYLVNKVHAYDSAGDVRLDTLDGLTVLCLMDALDGEAYETRIYFYDGAICEQFVEKAQAFFPENGERLTEVRQMQFNEIEPKLLRVDVVLLDGSRHSLHMALSAERAG